jgi:polygalacturonase
MKTSMKSSSLWQSPFRRGAFLTVGFVATLLAPPLTAAGDGLEPIAPIHAPFAMPQLQRPVFPERVFDIREYGAVAGGEVKNTEAFAKTVAACAEAGGGRVLVPAGKWLTGPIHLKSNMELHLAEGAEVIFSDRFENYLPVVLVRVGGVELYNYSPLIYARDCENVGITGPGKLNGNAKAWWDWKAKETKEIFQLEPRGVPVEKRIYGTVEAAIRPSFVVFFNCKNVLYEGFTIGGGPNWTIHPIYCENIIIRRVNVDTDGPNNDGVDPDSCRNLLIEHCTFSTGDDCVVLKSGYNEDGWRVNRPTENVVMRHCFSKRGHGGLVIGSEMSGSVRNVYMHDCEFDGTDRAVRIKSRRDLGGVVENVWAENLQLRNMKYEAAILNMDYTADRNALVGATPPVFQNIHLKNIVCEGAPEALRLVGADDSLIQNVTFENVTIRSKKGVIAKNVQGISFKSVRVTQSEGPTFDLENAQGISITGSDAAKGTKTFVRLAGATTAGVSIAASDLSAAEAVSQLEGGAAEVSLAADVKRPVAKR